MIWAQPGDISQDLNCLSLPLALIIFIEEDSGGFGFSRSKKIVLHLLEAPKGIHTLSIIYRKLVGPFFVSTQF